MSRVSGIGQQLRSLVRKAGVLVGTRTYLNFVEGSNTTITVADDSVNDEVTVTIASSAGGAAVADGPGANDTVDATGAAGVSASAARVDHGHQLATYSSAAAAVGTAAAGTSTTAPSRGDHVHATGAGTPSTQAFGDAAATGTGPAAAMTDHKHAMPSQRAAASASPAAIGTAAAGTGTTDARDDHVHATGAGTPSTQAFGDSAATGSGPAAAMTDHKHAMPAASTVWTGPAALSTVVRNTLAGAVDNYALAAAEVVSMFDVGASNRNFSGMAGGTDGRAVFITNSAAANNLILLHDSTSTAANRFYCPSGNDVRLRPRQGVWAVYDNTLQRWVLGVADAPNAGPDANVTVDSAGAAGTVGQYARSGHGHQVVTQSTAAAAVGTAAAGTSGQAPSRGDHVHATGAGTPSTQAFGDAASTGTGPAAAMTDHKHAMPSNVTGPNLSLVGGTRPNVNGLLAWTEDNLMHSSNKQPAAATIYLRKIMVPTTTVFTNLMIMEAVAGTSYTNAQLGLYTSAGTLLGSSAVQASAGTNGFGAAAPAVVTLPLTVVGGQSLTVTGGDSTFVWAAVHMGTNSATAAQFVGSATGVAMTNLGQAVSLSRAGTIAGHATNNLATIGNITPGSISQSAPLNIWFGVT